MSQMRQVKIYHLQNNLNKFECDGLRLPNFEIISKIGNLSEVDSTFEVWFTGSCKKSLNQNIISGLGAFLFSLALRKKLELFHVLTKVVMVSSPKL